MGLKKTNHLVKKFNQVLPEAYAYIVECKVGRSTGYAIIGIFSNRADASNHMIEPYERIRVDFDVNRTESAFVTAYLEAKKPLFSKVWNTETKSLQETVVDERFSVGWEDDIIY